MGARIQLKGLLSLPGGVHPIGANYIIRQRKNNDASNTENTHIPETDHRRLIAYYIFVPA